VAYDTIDRIEELAQLIQTTIESWIACENANYEPRNPPGFGVGFVEDH
jgi:hypothetical protein